ncbi:MAG: hypothetical protein EA398_15000 [Deltaproteobacteria bacterium]|nr:MAG: hypothetical protein EA398_15000 [Deltaproteobacteria bacterium]
MPAATPDREHSGPDSPLGPEDDDPTRRLVRVPVVVGSPRPGITLPYSLDRVYGVFYDCRRGGRHHRGLDLGGVGPDFGLGTPVRAMVRSRITFIGTPESDPRQFGRRDTRPGTVERRGRELPRSGWHGPYGEVFYFTRDYGSWHAGVTVIFEALESEIAGHQIRYMHLAAIHPELRVGDEVEAGQEVGLMGGTAVMRDLPHVHIDIETPEGRRVDVAPLVGLEADTPRRCRR